MVDMFQGCGTLGEVAVVAARCSTLLAQVAHGIIVIGTVEFVSDVGGTLKDCQPFFVSTPVCDSCRCRGSNGVLCGVSFRESIIILACDWR